MDERERLAAEIDRHWMQRLDTGVGCTCGGWFFAIAQVHPLPEMGERFLPFSKHVADALAGVSPSTGEDRLREAILVDRDGERCDCDWMGDVEPLQDCPGCDHQVRLYRDNVLHHDGRHYHRGHVAFAALRDEQ